MADLHSIAERLYGLRPDEFTAARTAAEKDARSDGDRELAAAVKALRRPAVPAWAVNLLVRQRRELVDQVVELGDQLRQAQSLLQGDALRDLARQRRQLVAAVASEARALAADEGQQLSDAALRQVEETLQAAMTDREAADAVRSGLLAQPLSSTGLASLAEVLAVPLPASPAPSPPTLTVVRDEDRAREDAQARVTDAGVNVRAAQKSFDKATKKRAKGEAKVLQLQAELEELRRKVAELEEQTDAAAERLTDLDADLEQAQANLEDARAEAKAASAALDEL